MKSNFSLFTIMLSMIFLLSGCQSPTPYQSSENLGNEYGYEDVKVNKNIYRISFSGNTSTSKKTVERFLLYRASQIANKNNKPYFQVVSRDTDKIREYELGYTSPAFNNPYTLGTPGYGVPPYPYYIHGYRWNSRHTKRIISKDRYDAVAYVKLLDKKIKNEKSFKTTDVYSDLKDLEKDH